MRTGHRPRKKPKVSIKGRCLVSTAWERGERKKNEKKKGSKRDECLPDEVYQAPATAIMFSLEKDAHDLVFMDGETEAPHGLCGVSVIVQHWPQVG